MSLDKLFSELKSQGFHGHAGRPGKRGGSLPKGGGSSAPVVSKSNISQSEAQQIERGLVSQGYAKGKKVSERGRSYRDYKKEDQTIEVGNYYLNEGPNNFFVRVL